MTQGMWKVSTLINTRILRERSQISSLPGMGFSRRLGVEGELTVPLAKLLLRSRFNVVDRFTGAYSGTFSQLNKALSRAKLTSRVKVNKADYLDWLMGRIFRHVCGTNVKRASPRDRLLRAVHVLYRNVIGL